MMSWLVELLRLLLVRPLWRSGQLQETRKAARGAAVPPSGPRQGCRTVGGAVQPQRSCGSVLLELLRSDPCCTAARRVGDGAAGAAALRARGAGGTELAHAGPVPGALRLQEAGADGEDHGRRPAGRRRLAERRVHRRHGGHHAARGPAAQRDPERPAGAGQGALGRRLLLRRRRAARELRHGRERRAQ